MAHLLLAAFTAAAAPEPYPIPGQGAVAWRNGCTSRCALLIMLHGAGGDGDKMARDSARRRSLPRCPWPAAHSLARSSAA